jgi:hypothetical protein
VTTLKQDALHLYSKLPRTGSDRQLDLDALEKLCRAARKYAHIQERWCSEEMTEDTTKRVERTEATLESKIELYAALFNAKPIFGGDPRGPTVRLAIPSNPEIHDDLAKEGLCVPGS